MKMKKYIVSLLSIASFLTACVVSEKDLTPPTGEEAGAYSLDFTFRTDAEEMSSSSGMSRADVDPDPMGVRPWTTANKPYRDLPTTNTRYLRKGTTVRILVYRKNESNQLTLVKNSMFRVKGSNTDNISYLSPITVNNTDTVETVPMKLPAGNYLFYAISPALPCGDYGEVSINNGQEYLANDWRFQKTVPLYVSLPQITDGKSHSLRIALNPLFNQMSRITLSLYTYNLFVSSVDLVNAGVTMDGLQHPANYDQGTKTVGGNAYTLAAHTACLFDTIRTTWTNHTAHINLVDKYQAVAKVPHPTNAGQFVDLPTFNVTTYVLPTESTSTPILVNFNGKVNGISASFSYNLTEKTFRPGYYYNYLGQLSLKSGVFTAEWQFVNWNDETIIYSGAPAASTTNTVTP